MARRAKLTLTASKTTPDPKNSTEQTCPVTKQANSRKQKITLKSGCPINKAVKTDSRKSFLFLSAITIATAGALWLLKRRS